MQVALVGMLVFLAALHPWDASASKLQRFTLQAYSKEGDVMFGGLAPVHMESFSRPFSFTAPPAPRNCNRIYAEMYQCVLAMVFATEEINRNTEVLPNITLGFRILDSCYTESGSLQGTFWLLTGQKGMIPNFRCQPTKKMAAIIGDLFSPASVEMARTLGRLNIPQISYGSGLPLLSDKILFPSFVRTNPSAEQVPYVLAQLVVHFGWTWVGILGSYTDYGLHGIQELKKEFYRSNVCVAFLETLRPDMNRGKILRIIQTITESKVKVIILYAFAPEVIPTMEELVAQSVTGKIWIASPSLIGSPLFFRQDLWNLLNGTIGVGIRAKDIPLFKEFQNQNNPLTSSEDIFIKPFWEHVFRCKWADGVTQTNATSDRNYSGSVLCTGHEQLETLQSSVYDINNLRFSYTAYNAVYVFAKAIHYLLSCDLNNNECAGLPDLQPWQLLHFVKNIHFNNPVGDDLYFDENGDPPHVTDILNWQLAPDGANKYVYIGIFDSRLPDDQRLTIHDDRVWWGGGYLLKPRSVCSENCPLGYREVAQEGKPVCCFDCILCSEGEFSNISGIRNCLQCPEDHWSNPQRDECIKKLEEFVRFDEALGAVLVVIAIVLALATASVLNIFLRHRETPIVRANNRTLSYLILISLILCFLCPLLFIGRPENRSCIFRQMVFGVVFSLCESCILAKTFIVVLAFKAREPNCKYRSWLPVKIPSSIILTCLSIQLFLCITWVLFSPPFLEFNMKDSVENIFLECNENSQTAFYCMLGFLGLLACLSFVVAFKARNLPDRFNETKWITFSMMIFLSVWTSFLPAYHSTKGKYMVAVEIFAILSSSAGVLGCIFVPKCYIVLLNSTINARKQLTGEKQVAKFKIK